jgi:hypothetical protein
MMSAAKRTSPGRRCWWLGGAVLSASLLSGCSLLYAELSTPVRSVPLDSALAPEPPADVVYLTVSGARIPQRTRDGRSWDKGAGSAPDAYAILFIDHVEVKRTDVVSDSFEPTWTDAKPVNYRLASTTSVRVELWDDNVLVAHPICSQEVKDVAEAAGVGSLEVNCESGAAMTLTVLPARAKLGMGLVYEKRGTDVFVSRVVAASAAGRAGIRAGEQIVSLRGRAVSQLTSGEVESIMNSNSKGALKMEIRGKDGEIRQIELREEAMYPVHGDGVEL